MDIFVLLNSVMSWYVDVAELIGEIYVIIKLSEEQDMLVLLKS